jgi:integrase
VKLKDLKPDRIQRCYAKMKRDGLSNHAIHCVHKVLNSALAHALKLGTLTRNPCKSTTPPKPKQTEMRIYDESQIQVFLDTALALDDQYYPLYFLAIHTGLRQGELIGPKWVDIDWRRGRLKARRKVTRPRGGGYRFSKPKSRRGNRTITLGRKALSASFGLSLVCAPLPGSHFDVKCRVHAIMSEVGRRPKEIMI